MSCKHFKGKILQKSKQIFHLNGLWAGKQFEFSRNLRAGVSKVHSPCLQEQLDEKHFFQTTQVFFRNFSHFEQKNSEFSKVFPAELSKLYFSSPGNTLRKNVFLEGTTFFYLFWVLSRKEIDFSKTLSDGLSEMHFSWQWTTSRKINLLKNWQFCLFFWILRAEKNELSKYLGKVKENCLFCVQQTL